MTTEQAIKLMLVEATCIERASNIDHPCTRECEKCDLLQKSADLLAAYSMAVSALRSQQWISVKDRLPEKLEPVNIVWVNRKPERYYAEIEGKPFVATGYYWNDKWWWYSATCEDYLAEYGRSDVDAVDEAIEITHWMPLPEPPKEARE